MIKRIQNMSFTSDAYGLKQCELACQHDGDCQSLAWSASYFEGDCLLYPKTVPLPARYTHAYDYHSYYTTDGPCPQVSTALELLV